MNYDHDHDHYHHQHDHHFFCDLLGPMSNVGRFICQALHFVGDCPREVPPPPPDGMLGMSGAGGMPGGPWGEGARRKVTMGIPGDEGQFTWIQ